MSAAFCSLPDCFICLKVVTPVVKGENDNNEEFDENGDNQGVGFCMGRILNYLKIFPSSEEGDARDVGDFSVLLCNSCFSEVDRLSGLFEELEAIRLKVKQSVKNLSQAINLKKVGEDNYFQQEDFQDQVRIGVKKQCLKLLEANGPLQTLKKLNIPGNGQAGTANLSGHQGSSSLCAPGQPDGMGRADGNESAHFVKEEVEDVVDVQVQVDPFSYQCYESDEESGHFPNDVPMATAANLENHLPVTGQREQELIPGFSSLPPPPPLQRSSKKSVPNKSVPNKSVPTDGLKPCTVCGKLVSKHYISSHMRVHTGEKPFECDFCKRRFAQASVLARHRRLHTGEKPYTCNLCGQGFTQTPSLKYHMKKSHGM